MVCARFSTKLLTHAQDGQAQYYGNTATNSNQEELQDSLADVGFALSSNPQSHGIYILLCRDSYAAYANLKHLRVTLMMTIMNIYVHPGGPPGLPQILSNNLRPVLLPYNLVESASIQMILTARLRTSYILSRLKRSMKNPVSPRHVIMMTQQKISFSRRPPSTAAFSVQRTGFQSSRWRLRWWNWHGRRQIRNPGWCRWHWRQILRK